MQWTYLTFSLVFFVVVVVVFVFFMDHFGTMGQNLLQDYFLTTEENQELAAISLNQTTQHLKVKFSPDLVNQSTYKT